MAHEQHQGASGATSFIDDRTGNRSLHMQANSRVTTTLMFSLSRTAPGAPTGLGADTTVTLPGGAIPVALRVFGAVNDATTAASITVGIGNTTSNYFLSAYNVANAPTGLGQQVPSGATNLFTALPVMAEGQSQPITGFYSVAGTSATGGPWYVAIDYYRPVPA